jgi:hypothetical protein
LATPSHIIVRSYILSDLERAKLKATLADARDDRRKSRLPRAQRFTRNPKGQAALLATTIFLSNHGLISSTAVTLTSRGSTQANGGLIVSACMRHCCGHVICRPGRGPRARAAQTTRVSTVRLRWHNSLSLPPASSSFGFLVVVISLRFCMVPLCRAW